MRLTSDTDKPLSAANHSLGKRVLEMLQKHYPAYSAGWDVAINPQGILIVRNTLLSGVKGFYLHTAALDPELNKVMQAGGHLLEMYRQSRSRLLTEKAALESIRMENRNVRGDLVPES